MEQYLQQPVSIGWVLLIVLAVVVINLGDWMYRRYFKKKSQQEIEAIRNSWVRNRVRDAYVEALFKLRHSPTNPLSHKEHEKELTRLRRDMGFDVTWRIGRVTPYVQQLKAELKRRRSNGITAPKAVDTASLLKSLTQGAQAHG